MKTTLATISLATIMVGCATPDRPSQTHEPVQYYNKYARGAQEIKARVLGEPAYNMSHVSVDGPMPPMYKVNVAIIKNDGTEQEACLCRHHQRFENISSRLTNDMVLTDAASYSAARNRTVTAWVEQDKEEGGCYSLLSAPAIETKQNLEQQQKSR